MKSGRWKINGGYFNKQNLSGFLFFSSLLHLGLFCLALLLAPGRASTRGYDMTVYEVRLVEMPRGKTPGNAELQKPKRHLSRAVKRSSIKVKKSKRLLLRPAKKKKRVITIAKKTVSTRRKKVKTQGNSSRLIEEAISKIKKKVRDIEEDRMIQERIARLKTGAESAGGSRKGVGSGYGRIVPGIALQLYRAEVEEKIKSNWSYPTALNSKEDLEAVIVLLVRRTGEIMDIDFKKRSGNRIFDESVIKAIKRSDPLPPFPEGYTRDSDEVEVKFNLRDLQAGR